MKRIVLAAVLTLLTMGMLTMAFNRQAIRVQAQEHTNDMATVSMVIDAFMTYPGHPDWNVNADLNSDGTVDMLDVVLAMATV